MRQILMMCGLFSLVVISGCKVSEIVDKAAIAEGLRNQSTLDLLETTVTDKYNPPADGRVTSEQMKMYIEVRAREKDIIELASELPSGQANDGADFSSIVPGFKPLGSVLDVITSDMRAAKSLGYNSEEYRWVKQQLISAGVAQSVKEMNALTLASLDISEREIKKSISQATNHHAKTMYSESLAAVQKTRQEILKESNDPGLQHNTQLALRHKVDFRIILDEFQTWAHNKAQLDNPRVVKPFPVATIQN